MHLPTAEDWFATRPWIDRPDADIDAHVERAEGVNKEVLRAKLYEWREKGVVIFEGAASPELVDAYVNDFAYLRNHPQEFSLIVNEDGKSGDLSIAGYTPERLLLVWHAALAHAGSAVKDERRTRQSYVTHYTSAESRPHWTSAQECMVYSANGGVIYEPKGLRRGAVLPSWSV